METKFRIWDCDNKVMQYSDLSFNDLETLRYSIDGVEDYFSRDYIKDNPEYLMQFTGRQDKDGVDIYDGDIFEFDVDEWGGTDNIHLVSWDHNESAWCWGGGSSRDMGYRKAIGNKFQNPGLLKLIE